MPYFSPDMGDRDVRDSEAGRCAPPRAAKLRALRSRLAVDDRRSGVCRPDEQPAQARRTSTLDPLNWNAKPLKGDPVVEVREFRESGSQDLLIMGSIQLVHALTDAGLVDEYHLFVHPVIVGTGNRLFREGYPLIGLRLADSKTFSGGVVALTYEPAAVAPGMAVAGGASE
jgi:riboflavin biosynthesis pyrimidine reductase